MSNKKIFKKLYSNKINKDYNYKNILKSIEKNNVNVKKNIIKWATIPVCLIILICCIVFLNKDDSGIIYKPSDPIISDESNYEIYINNVNSLGVLDIDVKLENVNDIYIPYFDFLSNLNIPKDFDNLIMKALYVKSDVNKDEYDILNSYNFTYLNTRNDRKIIIAFSKDYIPLRDCYFKDKTKASIINNTEVIIIKYNYGYNVTFTYNGINFDIETSHITEQELIDFLISLIR